MILFLRLSYFDQANPYVLYLCKLIPRTGRSPFIANICSAFWNIVDELKEVKLILFENYHTQVFSLAEQCHTQIIQVVPPQKKAPQKVK